MCQIGGKTLPYYLGVHIYVLLEFWLPAPPRLSSYFTSTANATTNAKTLNYAPDSKRNGEAGPPGRDTAFPGDVGDV